MRRSTVVLTPLPCSVYLDEMQQLLTFLVLVILTIPASAQPAPFVLVDATVYTGTGERIEHANILVEDGRISRISTGELVVETGTNVIDLEGKFVMPGMIDAHVHFFQTGFFDSRPDVVDLRDSLPYYEVCTFQARHPERYYEAYLRSGITGVYDVGGFTWSLDLIQKAERNQYAPHVSAAGPLLTYLSPQQLAIYNTPADKVMIHLASEEQARQAVRLNHTMGATGIKIWGYAPDDEIFQKNLSAATDEARKLGNNIIAHATRLREAKMALRNGAELLVHSVSDSIVDQEFIDLAVANEVIYNPTLVVSLGYIRTFMSLRGVAVPYRDPHHVVDPNTRALLARAPEFAAFRQGWMPDSSYLTMYNTWITTNQPKADSIEFENLRLLHQAGIRIAVGTDAGNPGTLHGVSYIDELEALQRAGFTPEEIIVMATKNGAEAMERYDDFGSVEEGKMADLIILEKDPGDNISNVLSITHVMRGGLLMDVLASFD